MRKVNNYKYHYFYKITNLINNHYYYGIHSTNDLNDGYMGSGSRLHHAYKKYGMENFTKEILKYFNTREELATYEAEAVTEQLVFDKNCYNCICGGETWNTGGLITVKDLSTGKYISISTKEYHNNYDKYEPFRKNHTVVYDKEFKRNRLISINEFHENKNRYLLICANLITAKDKYGNFYSISKDDPRYLNGELVHNWLGLHRKDETKQKMHETHLKNHHLQGEKNSQYGTCWIHNDSESIKIKKEQLEEYISNGWIKGRKMKFNNSVKDMGSSPTRAEAFSQTSK